MTRSDELFDVQNLHTQFPTDRGTVRAVDGIDLTINEGEIVGLVGESGSGKSVLAESIMRIVEEPGDVVEGDIRFRSLETVRMLATAYPDHVVDISDRPEFASNDAMAEPDEVVESDDFVFVEERNSDDDITAGFVDFARAPEDAMAEVRGGQVAMVFQDPMNSLNPTLTVGEQIAETVRLHQDIDETASIPADVKRKILGGTKNSEAWRRAIEMLEAVEIPEPESRAGDYPHEFSGGMRQRAMIAMALSCEPDLLVADEPTTALDVTIQAQILDELAGLKDEFDTSILLITHDLAVIAEVCDRVNVMYAGEIVERADATELFANPQHPYTQGLIDSTPRIEESGSETEPIPGNVPDLVDIPYACHFAPRCPEAKRECFEIDPDFRDVGAARSADGGQTTRQTQPESPSADDHLEHEAACLRRGPEDERL